MAFLKNKVFQLFLIICMVVNGMENEKPVLRTCRISELPDDTPTIGISADNDLVFDEKILKSEDDGEDDDRDNLLEFENVEEMKKEWRSNASANVCLLRMTFNGFCSTGSGIVVVANDGKTISKKFIRTAGHCLVKKKRYKTEDAHEIVAYFGCISLYEGKYISKIPCTKFYVHPKYFSRDSFISDCHDIAEIEIPDDYQNIPLIPTGGSGFKFLGNTEIMKHINHETMKGQLLIVGYPCEKRGCWEGKGSLLNSSQNKDSDMFDYIATTTKGQSGGPLFLLPPFTTEMNDIIAKSPEPNAQALLIGFVKGGPTIKDNYGVKLCSEITMWQAYKVFWDGNYVQKNL